MQDFADPGFSKCVTYIICGMKSFYKKFFPAVLSAVFSILGFAGCKGDLVVFEDDTESTDHKEKEFRAAYGTPNCDFKVDVTVVDEKGKALEGIKVIPAGIEEIRGGGSTFQDNAMLMGKDTLTTASKGKATHTYNIFSSPEKFKIYFEDLDGNLNGGSFAKDSMDFAPVQTKKGDNHWYSGEYTISGTKKMKKE